MSSSDAAHLFEELTAAVTMAGKPTLRSLLETVDDVERFGTDAARLVERLAPHIPDASPETAALLHRMARTLADCSLGIKHAVDGIGSATRAALSKAAPR